MSVPYTKSGKCGQVVWQRNRHGQICYPAFIPANPNTPAQRNVRGNFKTASKHRKVLTDEQQDAWKKFARGKLSRPRLGRRYPLPAYNVFVQVNVRRLNQGLPLLDFPPIEPRISQPV